MYKRKDKPMSKRYFEIEISSEKCRTKSIRIECPKVKTLRKMQDIGEESTLEEICDIVSKIISKNADNCTVQPEEVEEIFDIDELYDFIGDFAEWISGVKEVSPN